MNVTDIKIPYGVSLLSGVLFLVSGIGYSLTGVSTGYVLVIIAVIVAVSAIRMKNGVAKDVKESGLTVLFFGILNIISFVFILSGASIVNIPFLSGFLASLSAVIGGYLGILYSKN